MFWPAWRLVTEKVATLQEVETWYSLDDVVMANEAIDLRHRAEKAANDKAERDRKAKAG